MRKTLLMAPALIFFVLGIAAQGQDFSKVQIKVQKVSGSVYMLEGAGGNIGVSVGDDGIVLVDDQYAPLAEKIRAALKSLADKPVRFVINTHYHNDHTDGNLEFQKTAPIIAQDNVRRRLEEGVTGGYGGAKSFKTPPQPAAALPVISFERQLTLHLNGEDIRVRHFPAGHTDGDSVVFFPKSNVVHMGDDFVTYGFPFVDINSGGSVRGLIEAVDAVLAQVPPDAKIIPGHGPLCGVKDMRDFAQMLHETLAVVQAAMKQGKTLEEMQQEKILARWDAYGNGDRFIKTDAWIETIYNDLSGKGGQPMKHGSR
jgi:cyclase